MAAGETTELVAEPAATRKSKAWAWARRLVWAGLIGGYLLSIGAHWYVTPDSALYLMLGENLADGRGYTLWGEPHRLVPPGYPLLIAAQKRLGLGTIPWLNFGMAVMTLGVLGICYRSLLLSSSSGDDFGATGGLPAGARVPLVASPPVPKRRANQSPAPRTGAARGLSTGMANGDDQVASGTHRLQTEEQLALATIAVFGFSHALHLGGIRLLSDVPFLLLMWAGLYCYSRSSKSDRAWLEAGTLLLLASCAMRVAGLPVLPGAAAGLVLSVPASRRRSPRLWLHALVLPLVPAAIAAAAYFWLAPAEAGTPPGYARSLSNALTRSPAVWIRSCAHNFCATGEHFSELLSGQPVKPRLALLIVWLPVAFGMRCLINGGGRLLVCVALAYLAAVLPFRPLIPRYLLPVAPVLILCHLKTVAWLIARVPVPRARRTQLAAALAVSLVVLQLPKFARTVYWQRRPSADRAWAERALLEQAADFLAEHAEGGQRFVTDDGEAELAFLSRVPSLAGTERRLHISGVDEATFDSWAERNVAFVVLGNRRPMEHQQQLQDLCRRHHFARVFENDLFEVHAARRVQKRVALRDGVGAQVGTAERFQE